MSDSSRNSSPQTYKPVVPIDLNLGSYHSAMGQPPQPTAEEARSSSESLKSPRTPRFAEATAVHSPVDEQSRRSPFADPQRQGNVGDVGFGYVAANDPAQHANDSRPPASPLKSALRVPGTARTLDMRSPTFREEYMLEKQEKVTEKANEKDLVRILLPRQMIFSPF